MRGRKATHEASDALLEGSTPAPPDPDLAIADACTDASARELGRPGPNLVGREAPGERPKGIEGGVADGRAGRM